MANLQQTIDAAWENRANISNASASAEVRDAVSETINQLDKGTLRVAEKISGQWTIHQWAKKAVDRKSTRLNSSHVSESRMPSSA